MSYLMSDDPELKQLIDDEQTRLENTLNLIAAENHSPFSVCEVMGSVLNTKTIEGYPGRRFHAGCTAVDRVENLAVERGKALFGAEYINVQPHSGTSANLAVYFSVLQPGDKILAMSLPHGGHLSHGHNASITSRCFDFTHYGVNPGTGMLDYDQVKALAFKTKPRMIVAGASSYPRLIDYAKMSQIAKEINALFMVDMAHLAGLVAAKVIPSPVPHSDFVTFTCYKTMMGGRGGVILARKEYGKKIDKSVFPGCQGTSAVNLIGAKALIFKLAMNKSFADIQKRTLINAKAMAGAFQQKGYDIVSGGTDNHQVLVDLTSRMISGSKAEKCLESVGLVLNRNVVPRDAETPGKISGVRIGTGAVSARGMGKEAMNTIADLIDKVIEFKDNKEKCRDLSQKVLGLCRAFPIRKKL